MTSPAVPPSSIVVKIGGSTLGAHDTTLQDLVALQREGRTPVVVHGGGAFITRWLDIHAIPSRFVRGLRVTDEAAIEVVTAVLAGLVNKQLVAAIQALGGRAAGFCGVDGGTIAGRIQHPDLGLVGEAAAIDLTLVHAVRSAGFIPVISTVGYRAAETASDDARILNLNADTVAGEFAAALKAELLVFLTDVPGVQDERKTLLPALTPDQATALIADGTASGGMIPKLEACLRAAAAGTICWITDGRVEHALLRTLSSYPAGTRIG